MTETPKIAIAGGGTGGHIAPALALADAFALRYGRDNVLFFCTGNDLETSMLSNAGYDFVALPVRRPRGGIRGKATTAITAAASIPKARKRLKDFGASGMICVGGYASLPGAIAARTRKIPVVCLEANAVAGKVTRTVSRFAKACFATFPLTTDLACPTHIVGNPLRLDFLVPASTSAARRKLGLDPARPTMLVVGGSQGAEALNLAAIQSAPRIASLTRDIQILHICGKGRATETGKQWGRAGLTHRVTDFTHDPALWFSACDIALTRAGAGTITELLALGKPMLLVPYPHASDNHQTANAQFVAMSKAGVILPEHALTPSRIAELLNRYLLNQMALDRLAKSAKSLARPEAGNTILDACLNEFGIKADDQDADVTPAAA